MLTHAFEVWNVRRVCLHTDARNAMSRAAIERLADASKGFCARIDWLQIARRAIPHVSHCWPANGRSQK
jgi:RimJ/RimL family protein N-acetyltransferase